MPSLSTMTREVQKGRKYGVLKPASKSKQDVFKSTERVADTDLESETESETSSDSKEGSVGPLQHVPEVNGRKKEPVSARRDVDSPVEEDEDDDEGEHENENDMGGEISRSNDRADRQSSQSENGTEGSNSDSESEEEYEMVTVVAQENVSHVKEAIQSKPDTPRAVPIYTPPSGFAMLHGCDEGKEKVIRFFSSSNLVGKQLWYITAPASVPIGAVKQVSLRDVQLGIPALSLNGHHYGFFQEQARVGGKTNVLIPDGESAVYRAGKKAVDQILHLQQIVQLPNFATSDSTETSSSQVPSTVSAAAGKRPRKQPEGLKMRFRPIGFGNGKTGNIGSSPSSSDTSSSRDTDADEVMEDAPVIPLRPLNLGHANEYLSKFASNPATNYEDTSSSGEETDDSPPAAAKNRPALNRLSSPSSRSMKRKLSDFRKDDKASNLLNNYVKSNAVPLKKLKSEQPISPLESNKANGNPDPIKGAILPPGPSFDSTSPGKVVLGSPPRPSVTPSRHLVTSKAKKITSIPPPRASKSPSSPSVTSKAKKITPIPPPRQSSILPPSRENSGTLSKNLRYSLQPGSEAKRPLLQGDSDGVTVMKAATADLEATRAKVSADQSRPENDKDKTLQDRIQATNPELSEKERKKEIRRLKKNQTIYKMQRESMNSGTSGTLDRSINASSPSRNASQLPSEIKPPPKSNINSVLSQDLMQTFQPKVEEASKNSKKHPSKSTAPNQNGKITKRNHEIRTNSSPLPRKASVILPPKFAGSLTR